MTRWFGFPLLFIVIPRAVTALQVSPGSPCAAHCLDSTSGNEWDPSSSNTLTRDITCLDEDYDTTPRGQKFKKCLECLQTSSKGEEGETDLESFVYNLRYTVNTCVFSKPEPSLLGDSQIPCNTCGLLSKALTGDGLSSDASAVWSYCTADNGQFLGAQLQPCIDCLRKNSDSSYLANFMTALGAGCAQHQSAKTLSISGSLFASDPINITDPLSTPPTKPPHPRLDRPAAIGIGVGLVVLFALAVCLFMIHSARRNASSEPEQCDHDGDFPRTPRTPAGPWHQAVSRARRWTGFHSRSSARQSLLNETNGDYYNRMEAASQPARLKYVHDPRLANRGPDNAFLTHPAYKPDTQISRGDAGGDGTAPRAPSPVAPIRKEPPQTPDYFLWQAYIDTVQNASRVPKPEPLHTCPPPAPSSPLSSGFSSPPVFSPISPPVFTPLTPPLSTPPSTARSAGSKSKFPSSLTTSKVRLSRRLIPSILHLRPSSAEAQEDNQLRISPPIMHYDARFDDSTPPPSSKTAPPSASQDVEMGQLGSDGDSPRGAKRPRKKPHLYIEVPMRNDENDLF